MLGGTGEELGEEAGGAYQLEEAEELGELVAAAVGSGTQPARAAFPRFREIVGKYQEQSQLLDPHLEDIIKPLAAALREEAARADSADLDRVQAVSRLVEAVSNTRGYKAVVKFFPNDAACLEPVTFLLQKLEREGREKTSTDDDQGGVWEAMCTLLLWLSMLVLIPFDLSTVDTSQSGGSGEQLLVESIIQLCQRQLSSPAKSREMAAVLLARLLTRPDTTPQLAAFLSWTEGVLVDDGPGNAFLLGSREALLPAATQVWAQATALARSPAIASNVLTRKLAVKLLQRVTLTFLEPRVPAWRYERASTSLSHTLGGGGGGGAPCADPDAARGGEEFEVVEETEEAIELLLTGLKDKDTVVRWSSAKGLGRVLGRLPRDLGDEVVNCIMELMVRTEPDSAWHGSCLALAELVRRGLLLPNRLPDTVPLIVDALHYDVRRGPHSVGAHVRDAAAYVCWAFARAYTAEVMADATAALAPSLLTVSCYDREVNCRRAASAAFQEIVGRHGNFKNGIDIITAADYFALSVRANAYLSVAPFVAGFAEYRSVMAEHLLSTKLQHWDKGLRCLAARALGALVASQPALFQAMVDRLLPLSLDKTLEVRHGACYGLGELLVALAEAGAPLSEAQAAGVANAVIEIEKARLYRGKGGEIMRAAACRLLECTAKAGVPVTPAQRKKLLDSLDEQLRHPNAEIQEGAAAALHAFTRAYMADGSAAAVKRTSGKWIELLHDANVAVRRGCALALGALPAPLFTPSREEVLRALCGALEIEEDPEQRDPESRVNAARALRPLCRLAAEEEGAAAASLEHVVGCLLRAMEDYSTDNRGDVGSWVRESLAEVVVLYAKLAGGDQAATLVAACVASMLKQAVERISRVREVAVASLAAIVQGDLPGLSELPGLELLQAKLADPQVAVGIGSGASVPCLVQLIAIERYRQPVFEGCVASIGGLDQALGKIVASALVEEVNKAGGAAFAMPLLLTTWQANTRSRRLATPFARMADVFFTQLDVRAMPEADAALTDLLALVKEEIRGCSDVPRLFACATVLCHLLAGGKEVRAAGLRAALGLLIHRVPKVRKFVAEQLYVSLLTRQDDIDDIGDDAFEGIYDVLTGTVWDGSAAAAKEARAGIYPLLGMEPPKPKAGAEAAQAKRAEAERAADENASYAALLADAERGLGWGMA
eukprot:jgi/Tetstr1/436476/TSEL_025304.t1